MHGYSLLPMKHYLNDSTNVNDTFVGAGSCRRLNIYVQADATQGEHRIVPPAGRITDTKGSIRCGTVGYMLP